MSERKDMRITATAAFTLIEILIVVAILAILTSLAVPHFQMAVQRADRAACASQLKTLGFALAAYRVDYNHFPLADGVAGPEPSPGLSEIGNGPAAGGSWDGAPRMLVKLHYLSTDIALFCPALRKRYRPLEQNFRYAYNSSAKDTFGHDGGSDNIDRSSGDFWLVRCLWVPAERSFHPQMGYKCPHGDELLPNGTEDHDCMENALLSDMRVNLRNGRSDFYKTYNIPYTPR